MQTCQTNADMFSGGFLHGLVMTLVCRFCSFLRGRKSSSWLHHATKGLSLFRGVNTKPKTDDEKHVFEEQWRNSTAHFCAHSKMPCTVGASYRFHSSLCRSVGQRPFQGDSERDDDHSGKRIPASCWHRCLKLLHRHERYCHRLRREHPLHASFRVYRQ